MISTLLVVEKRDLEIRKYLRISLAQKKHPRVWNKEGVRGGVSNYWTQTSGVKNGKSLVGKFSQWFAGEVNKHAEVWTFIHLKSSFNKWINGIFILRESKGLLDRNKTCGGKPTVDWQPCVKETLANHGASRVRNTQADTKPTRKVGG